VDPGRAAEVVGATALRADADAAQRRSMVVLENRNATIPLRAAARIFGHGVDPGSVRSRGGVPVARLEEAEVAIVRVSGQPEASTPENSHVMNRALRVLVVDDEKPA
jgi:beta-glucosidase